MASLADFLRGLFEDGRIVHQEPPIGRDHERAEAVAVLESAFHLHRLDIAGPIIPFGAPAALAAGELVRRASWFLVNRSQPVGEMERGLSMPPAPRSASDHLSADLALRFLPQMHRRARSLAPGDRLPALLAEILRRWPLSGVLADVEEGPAEVGNLGGHPGLRMLYAERLARAEKPDWMPRGPTMIESVELVFQGLGKSQSPLLRPAHQPVTGEGVSLG